MTDMERLTKLYKIAEQDSVFKHGNTHLMTTRMLFTNMRTNAASALAIFYTPMQMAAG